MDYKLGPDFIDWLEDGCKKAVGIIEAGKTLLEKENRNQDQN